MELHESGDIGVVPDELRHPLPHVPGVAFMAAVGDVIQPVTMAQDLDEQVFLAPEVVQQPVLCQAYGISQLPDSGPAVPNTGYDLQRLLENFFAFRNAFRIRTLPSHTGILILAPENCMTYSFLSGQSANHFNHQR